MHHPTTAGIGDFLYRLPEFKKALAALPCFDNGPLLEKVDELIAN